MSEVIGALLPDICSRASAWSPHHHHQWIIRFLSALTQYNFSDRQQLCSFSFFYIEICKAFLFALRRRRRRNKTHQTVTLLKSRGFLWIKSCPFKSVFLGSKKAFSHESCKYEKKEWQNCFNCTLRLEKDLLRTLIILDPVDKRQVHRNVQYRQILATVSYFFMYE